MNWELFGISAYVLMMLFIGVWVSKRIKNDDDYFLGGRSLGPFLATFSIFATWFGAETCIGTAGTVYKSGLGAIRADPAGYTICLLVMAVFFAKVLWKRKITTIPDLFRARFSPATEKFAAILLIPGSIIWAGAQVRALGQIISATTEFAPGTAITIAATVVIIYTTCGGLLADAYADLIQGIAVIIGLVFMFFTIASDMGGLGAMWAAIPSEKLSFNSGDLAELSFLGRMELWMVPILGSLMAQELVSRVVASRSEKIAANSALRAAMIYFVIGCIPVFIGLVGERYFPELSEAETLLPMLAKHHLHYAYYIIFIGALVSAILSTVDTTLLASSALASHNLIYPAMRNLSERQKVFVARVCTVTAGVIAYAIAFSSGSITDLVEMASSLGGPSVFVMTIIALWVKKGGAKNAIFAILMSVATWFFAHYAIEVEYPVILTVIVCGISYFASLPFTREEPKTEMSSEAELS